MAFSALEALQAFGAGRQMAQQDRQMRTRAQASQQAAAGDYEGAATTALGGGEYDLAGQLRQLGGQHQQQALQEADILGGVSSHLAAIPDAAARQAEWEALRPRIEGLGVFGSHELDSVDLSDAGLRSYANFANSIRTSLHPQRAQEPTSFQQDLIAAGIQPGSPQGRRLLLNRYAPQPRIIMGPNNQPMVVMGGEEEPPATETPPLIARDDHGNELRLNSQTNQWEPVTNEAPAFRPAPGGAAPGQQNFPQ